MENITAKENIESVIKENEIVLLYFTGMACGACEIIKGKIQQILKSYPRIKAIEVNGESHPEVARDYGVYALPLFILFVEGKETIREGRNVDLLGLEGKFARYYELLGLSEA